MNMLIIGNGFDLAHGRPTAYSDFLQFLEYILSAKRHQGNKSQFQAVLDDKCKCPAVKDYILSSFDTRQNAGKGAVWNTNAAVQELYDCLNKNVWYGYFQQLHKKNKMCGKSWIDFEGEIRKIIEYLDRKDIDVYSKLSDSKNIFDGIASPIFDFYSNLDFSEYNQANNIDPSANTYFDFIEKTYQDLEKLIRCLEIYLDACAVKMPVRYCSPDIQRLRIDSVLSFNYTSIPADIYPSLTNIHYIHGCAKADRPAAENNMVLGVNEYWDGPEKDTRTNFNLYKKFVQRIIKETGIDYKNTLNKMSAGAGRGPDNIYIFGHSLDITDGDILREVMLTKGVVTTIFYRNKQQQANQIANLSRVLGQDELLERTFSTSPAIIFKRQAEMAGLPAIL